MIDENKSPLTLRSSGSIYPRIVLYLLSPILIVGIMYLMIILSGEVEMDAETQSAFGIIMLFCFSVLEIIMIPFAITVVIGRIKGIQLNKKGVQFKSFRNSKYSPWSELNSIKVTYPPPTKMKTFFGSSDGLTSILMAVSNSIDEKIPPKENTPRSVFIDLVSNNWSENLEITSIPPNELGVFINRVSLFTNSKPNEKKENGVNEVSWTWTF